MKFPASESSEFPNDNPQLHCGASWVCLNPLSPPRAVARPEVLARAGSWPEKPQPETTSGTEATNSTVLPPASSEADELVLRMIDHLRGARGEDSLPEPHGLRLAPLARFMLEELPNYRLRRSAVDVPAPPGHVYGRSQAPFDPQLEGSAIQVGTTDLAATDLSPPPPAVSEIRELAPAALSLQPVLVQQDSPLSLVEAFFDGIDDAWMPVVLQTEYWGDGALAEAVQVAAELSSLELPSEEIAAQSVAIEAVAEAPVQPVSDDYTAFVQALSDVALQRGATRGAALIPVLLEGGRVPAEQFGETLAQQLSDAGVGALSGDHFVIAAGFSETARAFRVLLSGDDSEFANCAETLDDWAARLVEALLPTPAAAGQVRRALRRQGVAAFGMLAAA